MKKRTVRVWVYGCLGDRFTWSGLGGVDGVLMNCARRSWKKQASAERHAINWYEKHLGYKVKFKQETDG